MQETEVKILNINVEAVTAKLLEMGAKKSGEFDIIDIRFDTPERQFVENRELLRVRKSNDVVTLTYKHNTTFGEDGIRSGTEEEVVVSDFDTIRTMLTNLGFEAFRHQQKKRVQYTLGTTHFEIDSYEGVPTYLEIEGTKDDIKTAILKLGYTMEDATAITASQLLKEHGVDDSPW